MKENSQKTTNTFASEIGADQATALARFVLLLARINYAAAGRAKMVASARMSLVATVTREEVSR